MTESETRSSTLRNRLLEAAGWTLITLLTIAAYYEVPKHV